MFVCLLDGLFYFGLIFRRDFVCLFEVSSFVCLFSLLIYKRFTYWLEWTVESWKVLGLGSHRFGDSVLLPIPAGMEVVHCIFSISLRSISSCGVL